MGLLESKRPGDSRQDKNGFGRFDPRDQRFRRSAALPKNAPPAGTSERSYGPRNLASPARRSRTQSSKSFDALASGSTTARSSCVSPPTTGTRHLKQSVGIALGASLASSSCQAARRLKPSSSQSFDGEFLPISVYRFRASSIPATLASDKRSSAIQARLFAAVICLSQSPASRCGASSVIGRGGFSSGGDLL